MIANAPALAGNVGYVETTSDGLYELRSNYGGVSIAAGLLCLFGAMRNAFERPALWFLLTYTGGYMIGRIAALPIDGVPSKTIFYYTIFEIVTAVLAVVMLRTRQAKA